MTNAYERIAGELGDVEFRSARIPYQLTPAASKGNAFCWLSYAPQINWRSTGNAGEFGAQATRSRQIEEKRAAGIDPLHIPGMGSKTDRDPMRFSTMCWEKRPIDPTQAPRTETLRAALKLRGPQSASALATVAHLESTAFVGALLKHDIAKGRVKLHEGEYAWQGK